MKSTLNIPAARVFFPESDRREILTKIDDCLRDGQVSQGPYVGEFERLFAAYIGCSHAIAVSSGGSAIEAAMHALGVNGKQVLVPTNTVFATAAGVLGAGGTVKLLDLDPITLAPAPETVVKAIGPETAGVIVVHVGGIVSRDIGEIRNICDRAGVWLFEDCAHAHGSGLGQYKAGLFGVGGAYSFFATKVMTSGEGGMFVTNDDALAARVRLLRDYGKPDPFKSFSVTFGLNWRLNEIAAILGITQLKRLDEFIEWRERVAAYYTERLEGLSGVKIIHAFGRNSLYKYIALLPAGTDKARLVTRMKAEGVRLSGGVYDVPLHRQSAISSLRLTECFPNADEFSARHICLPVYVGMTNEEVRYVVDILRLAIADA